MSSNQQNDTVIEINNEENNVTSRGIFDFIHKGNDEKIEKTEEKIEIVTGTETGTETNNKVEKKTEKENPATETIITIENSTPTQFPELNLYEDAPLLKDIPFDIYDDSIKLQPQNPYKKGKNYNTMSNDSNEINLYEDTPEMKKTIFQKIKEIINEILRLISVAFFGIISFIWSIIGGVVIAIWLSIVYVYHQILKAIFRCIFKSAMNNTKRMVTNQITEITDNIWDINSMIITSVR